MQHNGHHPPAAWMQAALDRFEGPLTRYAQRITRDAERARDVVQETFFRLCREDPSRHDGHLAEWLYTVCRNTALDVRRKEQRMATMTAESLETFESSIPSPEIAAERSDTRGRLAAQLGDLPANQQSVLRLKFQHGLTYREISAATGLTESYVGVLIHLGIKTLRKRIGTQTF